MLQTLIYWGRLQAIGGWLTYRALRSPKKEGHDNAPSLHLPTSLKATLALWHNSHWSILCCKLQCIGDKSNQLGDDTHTEKRVIKTVPHLSSQLSLSLTWLLWHFFDTTWLLWDCILKLVWVANFNVLGTKLGDESQLQSRSSLLLLCNH